MTESLRRADRGSRVAYDLHPGQRKREQEREQAPGLGTSHEGTKWPRRHARAVVYPLRTVGRVREDRESYFAGSALDQVLCRGRSAWACQSSSLSAANRGLAGSGSLAPSHANLRFLGDACTVRVSAALRGERNAGKIVEYPGTCIRTEGLRGTQWTCYSRRWRTATGTFAMLPDDRGMTCQRCIQR